MNVKQSVESELARETEVLACPDMVRTRTGAVGSQRHITVAIARPTLSFRYYRRVMAKTCVCAIAVLGDKYVEVVEKGNQANQW
jgi:hypothetical protein